MREVMRTQILYGFEQKNRGGGGGGGGGVGGVYGWKFQNFKLKIYSCVEKS